MTQTPPGTTLTLKTLGGARLLTAAGEERLGPGKPLAFLTYLACSPRRTASREHLLDIFWADLTPEKARHALRQTVWYLRQIFGDDGLLSAGDDLVLAVPLGLDRNEFLAAVDQGDIQRAAELYAGDFLEGFAAPGSVDFEQWADVERQRLRAIFLRIAEKLVRQHLNEGKFREAQALARRARTAAPGSEAAWRLVLDTCIAAGDDLNFSLESTALIQLLVAEGREPEPATILLLERGREKAPVAEPEGRPPLNPALVGREAEFATIIAAWQEVTRAAGRHLHLSASPGLGKTRLLTDARRRLRGLGAPVVSLRANPGDRAIPLSFAAELARAVAELPGAAGISPDSAGVLVALNPTLSSRYSVAPDNAIGGDALRRRSVALGELLTAVSEEQPVALLLDDLHWADQQSLRLLRPIFERLDATRILLVTAARPTPGLEIAGERTGTLPLALLAEGQIAELLISLGQLPDEPWTRTLTPSLLEATAGNPLLILETLQLAIDRGYLELWSGGWRCPEPGGLGAVLHKGGALRSRIERLEPEPRALLLLLATAGTALGVPELAEASGRDEAVVAEALTGLEQRALVQRAGEQWQVAHDEIGQATVDAAADAARRETHARLGALYAAHRAAKRGELARAAMHYRLAGRENDLRGVFLRYIRLSRAEGDNRRLAHLAQDFLDGRPEEESRLLVQRLGRLNRARYGIEWRTVANVAAVLLFAAAGWAYSRWLNRPDAVLYLLDTSSMAQQRMFEVPVRLEGWDPDSALRRSNRPERAPIRDLRGVGNIFPGPEAGTYYYERELGEPNTWDIFRTGPRSTEQLVMTGPRDDQAPTFSPDGRYMAFVTTRYSRPGVADDYDIALLDRRTSALRPLSSGRGNDVTPRFSPDGLRVAYVHRDGARNSLCWQSLEPNAEARCAPVAGVGEVVGWEDPETVLLTTWRDEGGMLSLVDVASGQPRPLVGRAEIAYESPDRRWVAVRVTRVDGSGTDLFVFPMRNPGLRRKIELGGKLPEEFELFWRADGHEDPALVRRVRIPDTLTTVPLGARYTIRVEDATSPAEYRPLALPVEWRSSDTTIARVTGVGVKGTLALFRPGGVTITARVGHLGDSIHLNVVSPRVNTVLEEDWSEGITAHWIPYGDPRPSIRVGPGGINGFNNGGDGSFGSGAYSREHWTTERGIGVEVQLSARVTKAQWQRAMLFITDGLDSAALGDWDHRRGAFPSGPGSTDIFKCGATYPGGEGPGLEGSVAAQGGSEMSHPRVDPGHGDGRWFSMLVQLFPDGTCGVAVDGKALWRSRAQIRHDLPAAVLLGYSSSETDVLHGPLTVWQGVRNEVNWDSLQPGTP